MLFSLVSVNLSAFFISDVFGHSPPAFGFCGFIRTRYADSSFTSLD